MMYWMWSIFFTKEKKYLLSANIKGRYCFYLVSYNYFPSFHFDSNSKGERTKLKSITHPSIYKAKRKRINWQQLLSVNWILMPWNKTLSTQIFIVKGSTKTQILTDMFLYTLKLLSYISLTGEQINVIFRIIQIKF